MKILSSLFLFLILTYSVIAQDVKVEAIPKEIKDHIKERVESDLNQSIVVGMIVGDEVTYFGYGMSAKEDGFKVDENTVYEIGSISKTFTTTLLANEVLKETMSLDDPISKFLPDGVNAPTRNDKQITLLDLATHSSGLPRMPSNFSPADPANPYKDYTPELMYQFLSAHQLARDVGESLEYSNYGMGLLGHILELKADKSYEELIIDEIAKPLNMNDTGLILNDKMMSRLALGHDNGRQVSNWDLTGLAGAGGIRSTAADMVNYIKANMGKLNSPITDAIQFTHTKRYEDKNQAGTIGLGWFFENDEKVLWHNGGTGGYRAFAGFHVDGSKGVVVLTNSTVSVDALGFKLLGSPSELKMPKKPISGFMFKIIEEEGVEAGIARYKSLKENQADEYNFSESELNDLGYYLLSTDQNEYAYAILKLNAEEHPESSNVYDSLGEVQLKMGDTLNALQNYKKSVSMNPGNANGIKALTELGEDVSDLVKEIKVSDEVLNSYVGEYQLAPNFSIVITTQENRLFAQATGQQKFEIFPNSETEFYLKVVEAKIEFNKDDSGKVESLTLFQNGQEVPGKKIE